VLQQKPLFITDTTFRDAHQSLLATRLRTYDMLRIAEAYARLLPQLFSIEMWGGATFDTALRFLKECPWQRLADLRERIPNILFQMLLRASNAVGYSNYPDNLVRAFVSEAAQAGIDVFRIFDSLNSLPQMQVAMEAVLATGAICEPAICYTGDVLNPARPKYNLKYYVDMARALEKRGAHILAIKDMAGLCKPYAAEKLVAALKEEIGIPVHFHTHDTTGVQAASILKAAEVGLDIADVASAPMSGMTSQANMDTLVEALRFGDRATGINPDALQQIANYWEAVREYYAPFEAGQKATTAEIYRHEMPGGQSTNLLQQAQALGLGNRWHDICRTYADVNQLFGDIVKVTPSSKAVGDMALFLVANDLSVGDVLNPHRDFAFPESVIDLMAGRMGTPPEGFPAAVRDRILQGQEPLKGRPGESLPPANLEQARDELRKRMASEPTDRDVISYLMFPQVFSDYLDHVDRYSDTSVLPTPVFFYRLDPGQEVALEIETGKTLIVQFLAVGDPHPDGHRTVFFELNGQPRSVNVQDLSLEPEIGQRAKANPHDPREIGAPMPGMVVKLNVSPGDSLVKGQRLLTLEAMKMQTNVTADRDGKVREVLIQAGTQVDTGDLVIRLE
jgi:pyruvate carboxylase